MADSRKQLKRAEIVDGDKGTVALVFSTFNVVDRDGDVTPPGAFEDGAKAPISAYGHSSWEGKLPVGVVTIKQTAKEAQAHGQFFMDTQDGADTFKTVKQLHAQGLGDWSYGYETKQYAFGEWEGQRVRFLNKLGVDEVSPVIKGVGVNTRTLEVKGAGGGRDGGRVSVHKGAIRPHETETADGGWAPSDVTRDLGMAAGVAELRSMHAWADPDGDPERKAAYGFMHHIGPGGPASIRACLIGIAVLNGAKGLSLPDDAKDGVYAHLAAHLADADRVAPDLRGAGGVLKLNDQALTVLADLTGLVTQATEVGASRALKGKRLTKANLDVLSWIDEEVLRLRALLTEPTEETARQYAMFVRSQREGE